MLFIILFLQLLYYVWATNSPTLHQPQLKFDPEVQWRMEQLKIAFTQQDSVVIYDFNPNFITDYKGYVLGMSPIEIDRLHSFRAERKFVNSTQEFQEVTLVSDSLLKVLSPYFKFPDWTQKPKRTINNKERQSSENKLEGAIYVGGKEVKVPKVGLEFKNINLATAADLRTISGVGEILSNRVIKFRDRLGGFVVEEQLEHVYGLEKEVVLKVWERFRIVDAPRIVKININDASAAELVKLVYINYKLANRIVAFREFNGVISSFEELLDLEDFPSEKIDIIQLYLQL
nr:helix-hairpin-helix domain-containing protein [Arenibacter sp. H213]